MSTDGSHVVTCAATGTKRWNVDTAALVEEASTGGRTIVAAVAAGNSW